MKLLRMTAIWLVLMMTFNFSAQLALFGQKTVASEIPPDTFELIEWSQPVLPDKEWVIKFNSAVDVLSVKPMQFQLNDRDGNSYALNTRTELDGLSVFIYPVAPLPPGDYELSIPEGIHDVSGKLLQKPLKIKFTVTDEVWPLAMTLLPESITMTPGQRMRFVPEMIWPEGSSQPETISFSWSLTGADPSSPDFGRITNDGYYTTPQSPGEYYVTATCDQYPEYKRISRVQIEAVPTRSVDFAVSDIDLDSTLNVLPGGFLSIRLKIWNQTPNSGLAGGSVVRFIVDGRVIDEVPLGCNSPCLLAWEVPRPTNGRGPTRLSRLLVRPIHLSAFVPSRYTGHRRF